MKKSNNLDLVITIGITIFGMLCTCYLWSFENGGNHWDLFGTNTERFLMKNGEQLTVFFATVLLVPLLFKQDKKRWITSIFSIPIFIFLNLSLLVFLD